MMNMTRNVLVGTGPGSADETGFPVPVVPLSASSQRRKMPDLTQEWWEPVSADGRATRK